MPGAAATEAAKANRSVANSWTVKRDLTCNQYGRYYLPRDSQTDSGASKSLPGCDRNWMSRRCHIAL